MAGNLHDNRAYSYVAYEKPALPHPPKEHHYQG